MNSWKIPIAFVAVILLPVLLAALSLHQGWFEPGTRNKGQWLSREIHLLQPLPSPSRWRLVYLEGARCELSCRQVPVLMQRIQSALGRDLDRLELVRLDTPLELRPQAEEGDMLLVDPQGLAVLRYEVPASTSQWPLFGKAVLSDLQQLLKYQRAEL